MGRQNIPDLMEARIPILNLLLIYSHISSINIRISPLFKEFISYPYAAIFSLNLLTRHDIYLVFHYLPLDQAPY